VTWPNATDATSAMHNATKKTFDILNRYEVNGEREGGEKKNEKKCSKILWNFFWEWMGPKLVMCGDLWSTSFK